MKPLECFWWPLHVYVDAQGALFVGSADYCCSGCRSSDVVDHLRQIKQQADAIGKEVSGSLQIVGQRPFEMGCRAIVAMKDLSEGKTLPSDIFTGLDICNAENADTCLGR